MIGVLLGWAVYSGVRRLFGNKTWSTAAGGFAAAWLSVVVASLAAAVELALSGASPWGVVLPAMIGVHALIGVGEGLITVAVAMVATVFAVFNGGERVTVRLGIATLQSVPLSAVVLVSVVVGMLVVFVAGLRADLRMRRMVRRYRQALGGEGETCDPPGGATGSA